MSTSVVTALKNNYNSEVLTINCSEDNLVIDDLVFLSSTNKPFIIIMDGYPLAECFMNRFTKNVIEVRFSAENQSEAVQRIKAVIHEQLDVIENAIAEVLGFIDDEEQGLVLVVVQVGDLFLDDHKHGRLTAFIREAQNGTEQFIEVRNTDGGQAHIFYVVLVEVQAFGKAPQDIGFPVFFATSEQLVKIFTKDKSGKAHGLNRGMSQIRDSAFVILVPKIEFFHCRPVIFRLPADSGKANSCFYARFISPSSKAFCVFSKVVSQYRFSTRLSLLILFL